ncbi:MAG: BsuPI-related putative proteinase inhibitor [Candidatus Thermoplasmatota archaeon]|nr:BsuPI-related putative proteinase inhibitor [Candidatus Thermoplasmatota archaeon]
MSRKYFKFFVIGAVAILLSSSITLVIVTAASKNNDSYKHQFFDEKSIIENRRTTSPYDIDVTMSTDKHSYQWIVEPVTVTVTVKNNGSSSVNLTFPTSQLYDIIIKNKRDSEIYQWSDNKYFIQVITEIPLQPGEAMNWDIAWYQQGRIFKFLPYRMLIPGTYSIQGIIPTIDTIMVSDEHEICIRLFP